MSKSYIIDRLASAIRKERYNSYSYVVLNEALDFIAKEDRGIPIGNLITLSGDSSLKQDHETYKRLYLGEWKPESSNNAFKALLHYDRNCILKYDRQHGPSITPPKGERMEDFALKYNTTVNEMQKYWREVEKVNKEYRD